MTKGNLNNDMDRRTDLRLNKHDCSKDQVPEESIQSESTENKPPANLAEAIRARFAPLGGVELEIPPREPMRDPPDFMRDPPDFMHDPPDIK